MCNPWTRVSRFVRFVVSFVAVVAVGGAALGGSLALLVPAGRELAFGTTSYGVVPPELSPLAQRSVVLDRWGNQLTALFESEDREPITLEDVPQHLVDAVLAIEDRAFYEHPGVDLKGTIRALLRDVDRGGAAQGGSTITQQLIKNALFAGEDRTVQIKIKEAFLAMRLEDKYSKDAILERYLNTVYLGRSAYGIKAASERYFDELPSDLTLAESALLAGLIQRPEAANPITHPDLARRRRAQVVDALIDEGKITRSEAREVARTPLPTTTYSEAEYAPTSFFLEEVKKSLLSDERLGTTEQERIQKLYRGGLTITTTFDPRLQLLAESAVRTTLPPGEFTAALVAIDNSSGAVRAIVGGPDFETVKFNLATQGVRQTGSTFKAITTATALELGYSPNDTVNGSAPCSFPMPNAPPWNVGGHGGGTMSLTSALAGSINCAFARLAFAVTPSKIVDMASRLGIDTEPFEAVPSITLGANPTSVLDMAEAFSVFAAEGVHHPPMYVTKVEGPDGRVIFDDPGQSEQVLRPNIARSLTYMLEHVVTGGTGTAARIDRPVAGKTGTTQRNADAWFVGYTPQISAAVWMGNPEAVVPMPGVYGGTYPARIFAEFMKPAHEGLPVIGFTPPDMTEWPSPQYIDETGRRYSYPGTTTSTSTTPVSTTRPPRRPPRPSTTTTPQSTTTTPASTTSTATTSSTTVPETTVPTVTTVPATTSSSTAPSTSVPPPTSGPGP